MEESRRQLKVLYFKKLRIANALAATHKAFMQFDYDQIPAGYYDEIYRRGRGIQSRWHREKFAYVAERLPETGRIIDIGCGPGTFIGSLNEGHRQFIGFDTAAGQIAYANETYGTAAKTFLQVPAPPYPIDSGSVDMVTAIELIEHLDHDRIQVVLDEAHRMLRPGGRLLLTTPNYGSLWPVLEWAVGKLSKVSYEEQHITRFTRKTLQAMLAKTPFQLLNHSAFLFSVPFVAALGWKAANLASAIEPRLVTRRLGFLLCCEVQKVNGER
jgi:SAM-dependent methyltransferase